jgi:alpha-1,2-rhamnosyltransferase
MNTVRRVYVECTHTYFAGGNSGIRRVARNLANQSAAVSGPDIQVIPVVWGGIGFFTPKRPLTEAPHFLVGVRRVTAYLEYLVGLAYQATPRVLRRPFTWAKRLLARRLAGRTEGDLLYLLLGLSSFPLHFLFGSGVAMRPGDIVVLVDSTWNSRRMLDYLFQARLDAGIRLGVMIHDLFPLTLPETCQRETVEGFTGWFAAVAPTADFFVTNSESTRSSLDAYLQANPHLRPYRWRAGSFRLGAELDLKGHGKKAADAGQAIWGTPGYCLLAVGTIEPRKNYALILDAFDRLLARNRPVSLVIVGRPGWKSDAVLERIASHPQLGTALLHLDNASDRDLAQAFERADCLVCASLDEGFGLPVVEGMMHGVPVLASAIPAFREIGGELCRYFPPDDPDRLVELIEAGLDRPERAAAAPARTGFGWIGWEESTRSLASLAVELADGQGRPG